MVKLKGPLFSIEARGSIGPVLTFSKRPSGNQVRFQKKQKDYISAPREQQRRYFGAAEGWWHELTPTEKEAWRELG